MSMSDIRSYTYEDKIFEARIFEVKISEFSSIMFTTSMINVNLLDFVVKKIDLEILRLDLRVEQVWKIIEEGIS